MARRAADRRVRGDGHREKRQFRKDIDRYEVLQELGWRVQRAMAEDVDDHPDASAAPVMRLLRQRRRGPGSP